MSRISFASVAAMPRHTSSRMEDAVGRAAGMRERYFHRHRAGDGDYGALLSLSAKSEVRAFPPLPALACLRHCTLDTAPRCFQHGQRAAATTTPVGSAQAKQPRPMPQRKKRRRRHRPAQAGRRRAMAGTAGTEAGREGMGSRFGSNCPALPPGTCSCPVPALLSARDRN